MRRLTLIIASILAITSPAYAATPVCGLPKEIIKDLIKDGYFESITLHGKAPYQFSIFDSDHGWVMVISDENIACIAAMGKSIWITKRYKV